MTSALIGYTGFVGSNLASTEQFDLLINRSNLDSLRCARLNRLVCAGLPAEKWLANEKPDDDARNLHKLIDTLRTVQAADVTVLSTIDVYPCTTGTDETYDCSLGDSHPYGKHRLEFEYFVRKRFPDASIVRLPALFGFGLKKNVLHDLLSNNRLERINPLSRYQWYPLARLSRDLRIVKTNRLTLVNLFPEPIDTQTLLNDLFPEIVVGTSPDGPVQYDLHTRHGHFFGDNACYVMSSCQVLSHLREFVRTEQVKRSRFLSAI